MVDFYLPEHNLIVEVDGPVHFITDPDGKNPQQRVKDRRIDEIHRAFNYRIERVPYYRQDVE